MKTITKYDFITEVLLKFGLSERSRSRVEKIYEAKKNNNVYHCNNEKDILITNFIDIHLKDYEITDK